MNLRREVFSHQETLWVLCLDEKTKNLKLPPLLDTIDWYNNQLLTKMLTQNKISLAFGTKTLLATSGVLPVSRLVVYGLGDKNSGGDEAAKDLNSTLEGLGEKKPWIVISPTVSESFCTSFQKAIQKCNRLSDSKISLNV
jgi:hypothetical protein